jgi:hypothetical protein
MCSAASSIICSLCSATLSMAQSGRLRLLTEVVRVAISSATSGLLWSPSTRSGHHQLPPRPGHSCRHNIDRPVLSDDRKELVAMRKVVTEVADVFNGPTHLQVGVVPHPFCIVGCIADKLTGINLTTIVPADPES